MTPRGDTSDIDGTNSRHRTEKLLFMYCLENISSSTIVLALRILLICIYSTEYKLVTVEYNQFNKSFTSRAKTIVKLL